MTTAVPCTVSYLKPFPKITHINRYPATDGTAVPGPCHRAVLAATVAYAELEGLAVAGTCDCVVIPVPKYCNTNITVRPVMWRAK